MEYLKGSFSVAAAPTKQYRDNWDATFKSRLQRYEDLSIELRDVRSRIERDWQARERIILDAMMTLFIDMMPDEKAKAHELKCKAWPELCKRCHEPRGVRGFCIDGFHLPDDLREKAEED